MEKILTIAIPTYNRRKQLIRLLKSIESQNNVEACSIVISDNCSDYSVKDSIESEFSGTFRNSITIYSRPINGGGDYNISSMFVYCSTELFWLIGDDDELLPGSIDKVIEKYKTYPDIPFFKYTMEGAIKFCEDIRLKDVDDLISCHKKGYLLGGIIFMSNNIYNVNLVRPYLPDCLYYGYCSVSQIIPMMHCLVDSEYDVLLCKDHIVKYNPPEGDHWNYIKIVTSLSTLLDINWGNNHRKIKKIVEVIGSYFGIGHFLLDNIKIEDKSYRNYIYWKAINTVFARKKNLFDYFAIMCYHLQRYTKISFLTGFYVAMQKKQTNFQNYLREKAKKDKKYAELVVFMKKHMPRLH